MKSAALEAHAARFSARFRSVLASTHLGDTATVDAKTPNFKTSRLDHCSMVRFSFSQENHMPATDTVQAENRQYRVACGSREIARSEWLNTRIPMMDSDSLRPCERPSRVSSGEIDIEARARTNRRNAPACDCHRLTTPHVS
jgi:hypothetical protein